MEEFGRCHAGLGGQDERLRSLLVAARTLGVNRVTAEVVRALRTVDVRPLLIKGPAIVPLLYEDGAPRRYVDSDLLVAPGQRAAAEEVLRHLGFAQQIEPRHLPDPWRVHAEPWLRRRDGALVDLHATLPGALAPPDDVWAALTERTARLRVGGLELETLDPAATALLLALHAMHHGRRKERPIAELERAIERVDAGSWVAAQALAQRIDAQDAYAAGLRLVPVGTLLADRLGLPESVSIELTLRAQAAPPAATSLVRILGAPGLYAKTGLVAGKILPSPEFLRYRYPLARRGRAGLVAAYGWRTATLAAQAWPAVRAWRRARRASVAT